VNHPEMADLVKSAAAGLVGAENIIQRAPSMGSDDMARFLEAVPGCYFSIGTGNNEKGFKRFIHTPLFDIDEAGLKIGVETMVRSTLSYLSAD
jgi:amidohydrolase